LADEAELAGRQAGLPDHLGQAARGYRRLWLDEVLQAEDGVDFAFCRPAQTLSVPARRAAADRAAE
jgi:dihydroxy-acid dehydratase